MGIIRPQKNLVLVLPRVQKRPTKIFLLIYLFILFQFFNFPFYIIPFHFHFFFFLPTKKIIISFVHNFVVHLFLLTVYLLNYYFIETEKKKKKPHAYLSQYCNLNIFIFQDILTFPDGIESSSKVKMRSLVERVHQA